MTGILWSRLPDDIPATANDRQILDDVFSAAPASRWRMALERAGLVHVEPHAPLIRWRGDTPYFNWSYMTQTVSAGAMEAVPQGSGHTTRMSYSLRHIAGLLKSQFAIARFLQKPDDGVDAIVQSLALGLALQSLMLRLGTDATSLAPWLANPDSAPARHRHVLQQMQQVQMRRTALSPAWKTLFPNAAQGGDETAPEFYWEGQVPDVRPTESSDATHWKGQPVSGGRITGLAVLPPHDAATLAALRQQYNCPLMLVFRQARPQAVEHYAYAGAVLFAQGGVLSHACCVARETGLPAVTALGAGFYDALAARKQAWLRIDAATGDVELLPVRSNS